MLAFLNLMAFGPRIGSAVLRSDPDEAARSFLAAAACAPSAKALDVAWERLAGVQHGRPSATHALERSDGGLPRGAKTVSETSSTITIAPGYTCFCFFGKCCCVWHLLHWSWFRGEELGGGGRLAGPHRRAGEGRPPAPGGGTHRGDPRGA